MKKKTLINGLSMSEVLEKETAKRTPKLWADSYPEYSSLPLQNKIGRWLTINVFRHN